VTSSGDPNNQEEGDLPGFRIEAGPGGPVAEGKAGGAFAHQVGPNLKKVVKGFITRCGWVFEEAGGNVAMSRLQCGPCPTKAKPGAAGVPDCLETGGSS
jgi:hypothetical protein